MKLIHLSDLHIGKKVNEYSMINEQKYILNCILEGIRLEKPQAVLISGDVYDKTTPPLEAVMLLDSFLNSLAIDGLTVILISGNHDSAERLSFGAQRMKKSGLYIKSIFDGENEPVTLHDEYGPVNFYSVPFIRISDVNSVYGTEITDYTEAFALVVEKMQINPNERNVLLSHQYVAGASFSESESSIGGIDCISKDVYAAFDYTALGHIHRSQNIGSQRLRYCGTPLKYSASEIGTKKSYTVVTLGEKTGDSELCDIEIRTVPLVPKHDMISIEGSFDELLSAEKNDDGIVTEDFVYAVLTDEEYIDNPAGHLRTVYPNLLNVRYSRSSKTGYTSMETPEGDAENRSPLELFTEFYRKQHDEADPDPVQEEILKSIISEIWGEENETD